jgi:hypothetical protein
LRGKRTSPESPGTMTEVSSAVKHRDDGCLGRLALRRNARHDDSVEDPEATALMLEALFDIRGAVYEIHDAIFEEGDDEEEEDDA